MMTPEQSSAVSAALPLLEAMDKLAPLLAGIDFGAVLSERKAELERLEKQKQEFLAKLKAEAEAEAAPDIEMLRENALAKIEVMREEAQARLKTKRDELIWIRARLVQTKAELAAAQDRKEKALAELTRMAGGGT